MSLLSELATILKSKLDLKANVNNQIFTGKIVLPSDVEIGSLTYQDFKNLEGVTSNIQTQLDSKMGLTGNAGTATKLQTARTINGVSFDGSANISVNTNNSEIIKFDSGTTEGTDLYSFNGSSAKTIDIKAGTNVTLTKEAGSITISADDTSVAWSEITSKPTTLSSYGITDAYTKTQTDSAVNTAITNLVNLAPAALDTLGEISTQLANDESAISALTNVVSGKQAALVSGTNIKTINGASVLGSGDIVTTQTTVTGNAGTATKLQTARTINGVSFDGSANISVNTNNSEIIKFDSGTTEGTDLYSFNGSSVKTIDIKAGTNVTLTKETGSITINAVSTVSSVAWSEITSKPSTLSGYGITDAAIVSHNHNGVYEPVVSIGSANQYFRGDKTWQTFPASLPASDVYAWAKASVKPSYIYSDVGAPSTTGTNATGTWNINITGTSSNADLLDGLDSSEFMRKSSDNLITSNIIFDNGGTDTNGITFNSHIANKDIAIDMYNGKLRFFRAGGSENGAEVFSIESDNILRNLGSKIVTENSGKAFDANKLDGRDGLNYVYHEYASGENRQYFIKTESGGKGRLGYYDGTSWGNYLDLDTDLYYKGKKIAYSTSYDSANVLDYGADPTGTLDSSVAFQNALNANKSVYVPKGTYLILKKVIVNTGNRLHGDFKRLFMSLLGEYPVIRTNVPINDIVNGLAVVNKGSFELGIGASMDGLVFYQHQAVQGTVNWNPIGITTSALEYNSNGGISVTTCAFLGYQYMLYSTVNMGQSKFEDIELDCMYGIYSTGSESDTVYLSNFHMWPFMGAGIAASGLNNSSLARNCLFRFKVSDWLQITNCFTHSTKTFLQVTQQIGGASITGGGYDYECYYGHTSNEIAMDIYSSTSNDAANISIVGTAFNGGHENIRIELSGPNNNATDTMVTIDSCKFSRPASACINVVKGIVLVNDSVFRTYGPGTIAEQTNRIGLIGDNANNRLIMSNNVFGKTITQDGVGQWLRWNKGANANIHASNNVNL